MTGLLKETINKMLAVLGVKIVNAEWGPRGFANAFFRIKEHGFVPRLIVDIGAARGEWTLECMNCFPDPAYFLIDALPSNFNYLDKISKADSNIKFWIGAIGAKNVSSKFYIHGDQSSFFESEYASDEINDSQITEVRTLDSFFTEKEAKPDIIKADVQGFEIEVLKGANNCLDNAEFLLLEVSYHEIYKNAPLAHDVISYAGSKGFRIFDICSYIKRPLDGELAYSDILFAKNDSIVFKNKSYC